MTVIPCMGGFCVLREHCLHYGAPGRPVERLCVPSHDGVLAVPAALLDDRAPSMLVRADGETPGRTT